MVYLKRTLVRGGILKIFSGDILKKQFKGYKKVLDHYINVPVQSTEMLIFR